VQGALARPFDVGGRELLIGSSIGVVMSGQFGAAEAALMIHAADLAMYQAKRGAIVRYEVEMTDVKR
jgi:GGDEF domain-containing protein